MGAAGDASVADIGSSVVGAATEVDSTGAVYADGSVAGLCE